MRLAAALLLASIAAVAATKITDPEAFIRANYQRLQANIEFDPPTDIYSPRLKALFDEDRRRSGGEVGCIEFNFWINGQDGKLSNVRVASAASADPNRKTVTARFVSLKTEEEIQFQFIRSGDRWLLDDVASLRAERWTLSKILHCW